MSFSPEAKKVADELSGYAFFQGFPADALIAFASMATERNFKFGDMLLEQGKTNNRLFFLRKGRLIIQVDGETVSELTEPGSVIGEMSLINRTPIAASVLADGDAQTFEVSEDYLNSLPENDRSKFQSLLDRVYASVLAERLTRTNEKAKKFETANRELNNAQKKLKLVNENLEVEISRRSRELVQKVQSLMGSHLQPTQVALSRWVQNSDKPIAREELIGTLHSVSEVIDFLKPVTDLGDRDQSNVRHRVLLVDKNKKQQNIAKLALGGTGIELSLASTIEEFTELLNTHEFDAIMCDADLKEAALLAVNMKPQTPLVLMVGLDMAFYLQMLEEFPDKIFFVSRDIDNRTFTIKNISTTVAKIINQDLFGLDKYLAWGTKLSEQAVTGSEQRLELVENMLAHFKSLGIRSTFLDRVRTATEELLMNMIYDAPVDLSGKSLFNHLPRTQKIILAEQHQGKLSYGTDGILLGVSVSDPFGALTKNIIIKYLDSCYRGQAGSLNAEKGGAGRGLKMLIDSSDLTIFNIESRKHTEVICLFNLEAISETFQPTFHLFVKN